MPVGTLSQLTSYLAAQDFCAGAWQLISLLSVFDIAANSAICTSYLKPENMQYTGAYKVRGAYYKISTDVRGSKTEGTYYSFCRKSCTGCCIFMKYGVKATVVMLQTTTPLIKVNRTMIRCRGYSLR